MINNNDDEIKNLLKVFGDIANATKNINNNAVTNPLKKINSEELDSEDLRKQLEKEAAQNYHKRRQRIFDFLTDSVINVIKVLAIVVPVVLGLFVWALTKHNGYPDVANEIVVLSKRFFDMFIGFLVGNFLNSIFNKNK